MSRLPFGDGPLLAAAFIAALATILVMNGYGDEVPQVVGAATAILAIFVGRPNKSEAGHRDE